MGILRPPFLSTYDFHSNSDTFTLKELFNIECDNWFTGTLLEGITTLNVRKLKYETSKSFRPWDL